MFFILTAKYLCVKYIQNFEYVYSLNTSYIIYYFLYFIIHTHIILLLR